ncbi:MAG: asparagine synthase (glutamine-hydrolyzing), partial [Roseburia sp.]
MCGIAGFTNFRCDLTERSTYWEDILTRMHESLRRRGDDSFGTYLSPHAGLSHARLSIRDVARGTQPMTRTVHGNRYTIVYNGEVYNTDELLPELANAGYTCSTTSDTEVILYSYILHGADFVSLLNGIFAFAIWDETSGSLFLYRDRAGVKPLFYAQCSDFFLFGSEPKALFVHPECTPAINRESLQEILAIGPARTPGCGVFAGLHEVLPGHYLTIQNGSVKDTCYWELTSHPHTDDYAATVEKTSFLVRDAVRRQMVSDVPVCTFLSGGIDSSVVACIAADA